MRSGSGMSMECRSWRSQDAELGTKVIVGQDWNIGLNRHIFGCATQQVFGGVAFDIT